MMTGTIAKQARWETRNGIRVLLSSEGETIYSLIENDAITQDQMSDIASAMQEMERAGETLWTMAQTARRIATACIIENEAARRLEEALIRIDERRADPEDYQEAVRWIRDATERKHDGTDTEQDAQTMARIQALMDREATA